MANKQNLANVNVGTSANDGSGDLLRDAFIKINDNFANIFANGQFLANITDNRGAPGYSWEDDKNTGLYNPEDGVIIVSLNGTDSLQMRSNGLISWRNEKLINQTDLNTAISNISSGGGGSGSGLEVVESLPSTGNFEGRFVLNRQDDELYLYQDGDWVLLKNQLAPGAKTGIQFVNNLPSAAESYTGRTVIYNDGVWIYRDNQWNELKDVADIDEDYSKIEVITTSTLPTTNLFQGRTCWYQSELYIYLTGGWRKYADYIVGIAGESIELAGSIKLWAGVNAPTGWRLCDGAAVSRTTYATLFSRIGTTYGNGDGSTTFNIPDFRDRTAIGVSATKTIGSTGGSADAVVVQHSHTATVTDPGHNHVPGANDADNVYNQALQKANPAVFTNINNDTVAYPQPDVVTSGPIIKATTGITVGITNQGVSGAGRNLPPYTTVNWIIKMDDSATSGAAPGPTASGLFYTVSIFKRSTTTPAAPSGGSFNFGNLTTTPPSTWFAEIPAGTDPVWISRALAVGTTPTDIDTTLAWSTPVIAYRDGVTQTVTQTGDPGPRSATGYIYYATATATAPSAPTATGYNFDTGNFNSLTSGWSTTVSAPTPVAGRKTWAVRYNVSEALAYGGTQTTVLSTVFAWQNFDGLVTFTNLADAFDDNVTTIDGGKIQTNTLEVDTIKSGSGTYNSGSFGLGIGTEVFSRPTVGYYKSIVDGTSPLISIHSAGGSAQNAHGLIGATTALNSFGATFYQLGSAAVNNTWGYAIAFLAGQKLGGFFGRFGDWAVNSQSNQDYYRTAPSARSPLPVDQRYRTTVVLANNDHGVRTEFYSGYSASRYNPNYAAELASGTYSAGVVGADYGTNGASVLPIASGAIGYNGYAFYAFNGGSFVPGGVAPFTGVHEGIMENTNGANVGDIVIDSEILNRMDVSNTRFNQILSSQSNQKGAIGVIAKLYTLEESASKREKLLDLITKEYTSERKANPNTGGYEETEEEYEARFASEKETFEKFQEQLAATSWIPPENKQIVDINSVGEGQINVCGEGGNIERGDLIVTSSIPGKGMKQADDIVRAYTVAKTRESVTFASNTEVKTIACVYLCG